MENKNFINLKLALFAFIFSLLLVGFASADASLSLVSSAVPANVTHNAGSLQVSFLVNINNTAGASVFTPLTSSTISSGTVSSVTFSSVSSVAAGANETRNVTATISFAAFQTGNLAGNLNIGNSTLNVSVPFTVAILNSNSLTLTKGQETTRTQNGTFTISNTGNTDLTLALSSSGIFNVSFFEDTTQISSISVSKNTVKTVKVVPINLPASLPFGTSTVTVLANDSSKSVSSTIQFSISEGFCRTLPSAKNLSIRDVDLSNSGEDDDNWKPLDKISVDVDVENIGINDLEDIVVEFGLFDSTGTNKASKLDFLNEDEEKIELGDLDNGDEETAEFEFKVPTDLSSGDYRIVVKAYSKDSGETNTCTDSISDSVSQAISVENEDDEGKFIAFDNIKISPEEATCSDSVSLSFDTVNIGEDDEDKVKVRVYSRELGLDLFREITEGLDKEDEKALSFSFLVPEGLADRNYNIELTAEYDYRSGVYRQDSDEATTVGLRVFGCDVKDSGKNIGVSITGATLDSEAKAGEELVVKSTIRNTGSEEKSLIIDAKGFDSWAELDSISDRIITIDAGESKEVTFKFNVKDSVSGEKSFSIEAISGNQVESREVSVNIAEAKSGLSLSLGNNALIWAIGIINVILIIIIIIVAVRVSRR